MDEQHTGSSVALHSREPRDTCGNRLHHDGSIEDALADVLSGVGERGGVLLIPSFAVGRTQQVLYYVRKLQ
ncbi:MAG: hypothetical protein ACE5F6_20975, partial [Anaerolineae bacterium]